MTHTSTLIMRRHIDIALALVEAPFPSWALAADELKLAYDYAPFGEARAVLSTLHREYAEFAAELAIERSASFQRLYSMSPTRFKQLYLNAWVSDDDARRTKEHFESEFPAVREWADDQRDRIDHRAFRLHGTETGRFSSPHNPFKEL